MISAKNCRGRIAGRCRGSAALSARRPTAFSPAAVSETSISEAQVRLIANAVDRSLCTGLSRRFQIALRPSRRIDRACVHHAHHATDEIAAAASSVTSIGMTVVKVTGVVTAAIPSLRTPIGLGGLALEAKRRPHRQPEGGHHLGTRGQLLQSPAGIQGRRRLRVRVGLRRRFSKLLVTGASPFKTCFVADHGRNNQVAGLPRNRPARPSAVGPACPA